MKIKAMNEIEPKRFDTGAASGVAGRILLGKADGSNNFCMRVFELAKDGFTPRHSHDWEHGVFVHSGQGAVLMGEHWVPLSAGSSVYIPPMEEHQFKNAGNDSFIFVCVVPNKAPEL